MRLGPLSSCNCRVIRAIATSFLHRAATATQAEIRLVLLPGVERDRKSTRLNSSHSQISYAVFCLKKKKNNVIRLLHLTRTTVVCAIYLIYYAVLCRRL